MWHHCCNCLRSNKRRGLSPKRACCIIAEKRLILFALFQKTWMEDGEEVQANMFFFAMKESTLDKGWS
jgi:hypothetical protein